MKREDKNQISRRKIMDSALQEFAQQGYGMSSVNTICSKGEISKGILYHYFKDKDELYLMCVKECFDYLTEFLREHVQADSRNVQEQLNCYFEVRFEFFSKFPMYQRIFCDAVISPPSHLEQEIVEIKKEFDQFNISVLDRILSQAKLRKDITRRDVIDTFRQYQDFINARYQMAGAGPVDARQREESCSRALSILLYGVTARQEEKNE